tara:strand:+ start:305 stop:664 length:360 start_codon:yes stop_codon:yes gene_type:complete
MKLTKATLKQLIQETIQENEGRYWDEDEPTNTPGARAKNELQTIMLDGAQAFLAQHYSGIEDERARDEMINHRFTELEDLLVDAMMDWNLTSGGRDPLSAEDWDEPLRDPFGPDDLEGI